MKLFPIFLSGKEAVLNSKMKLQIREAVQEGTQDKFPTSRIENCSLCAEFSAKPENIFML